MQLLHDIVHDAGEYSDTLKLQHDIVCYADEHLATVQLQLQYTRYLRGAVMAVPGGTGNGCGQNKSIVNGQFNSQVKPTSQVQ